MSIGKSAIKRVENNGYSKVKSDAPDMQNSHVIAAPNEEVMEKLVKPVEKKTVKTQTKKTATSKKCVKTTRKDGFVSFAFGEDLPYYLL